MQGRKAIQDYKNDIPGSIGKYNREGVKHKVYAFPTLFKKTARGNVMTWEVFIRVEKNGKEIDPKSLYDEENHKSYKAFYWTYAIEKTETGGTPRISNETEITQGKNIGKKNETNAFTQALSQTLNLYKQKIKSKYRTDINAKDPNAHRKPPMRFELIEKNQNKVVFPAYLPPKLDGVFAETVYNPDTKRVEIVSRQLIPFDNVPHHLDELKHIYKKYPKLLLFGEFYEHGKRLQDISGITRDSKNINKLHYYVFDGIMSGKLDMPFQKRRAMLMKIFEDFKGTYVQRMKSPRVNNEKEMKKKYKSYLDRKYEGAMFYRPDGIYKFFYTASRSNSVFKMKPRYSDEFKIIGFKDGAGKNKGLVTFIMQTDSGITFNAEPNMTEVERSKLFIQFQKKFHYKGKLGTITYSDLSARGVPQQPKFIKVREKDEF